MAKKASSRVPVVFISSTIEDLESYRRQAREAALAAGFFPRRSDDISASGNPPLKECLARISSSEQHSPADLLIVIVAYHYGWVPKEQPAPGGKSITWLECLEADKHGKEVLAFLEV